MSNKIGLIGVGLMGHGIARNIVGKGWSLQFLNHPGNQPVQDLLDAGATAFDDAAELARASDMVLLCVTGTPQVEAILTGTGGILPALRAGQVVIDCSTAIPSSTERLAAAAAEHGVQFADAAMTRTPKEAAAGRLNLLVGAEPAVFERIQPLLQAFAENIFHAGPVGAGHRLKLLHNFVSLGSMVLLSEAAACAHQGGIAPEVLVDTLRKGGGYGAALDRLAPFLLAGDDSAVRFSLNNALKDIGYYDTMADDEGVPRQTAAGVRATLQALVDAGLGTEFVSTTPAQLQKI